MLKQAEELEEIRWGFDISSIHSKKEKRRQQALTVILFGNEATREEAKLEG